MGGSSQYITLKRARSRKPWASTISSAWAHSIPSYYERVGYNDPGSILVHDYLPERLLERRVEM